MNAELTEDRLLGGRVALSQPLQGYRVGIEPVLLAATIDAPSGARIADLGCGVGAAALCLLARRPDVAVTGIERDARVAALARINAATNGVSDRFAVIEQDVRALRGGGAPFQAVMTNPPFHDERATDASPIAAKRGATIETDLAGWIDAAARLLEPRGTLTIIYRADRLDALLAALGSRFGGAIILPLWPREGVAAKRLVLRAVLGSRAPLTLQPGLVLHGAGNSYTQAAAAVLREAAPLNF